MYIYIHIYIHNHKIPNGDGFWRICPANSPPKRSRAVNATSSGTFQTQLEHREFIVALIHLRIWVSEQLETWKKYGSVGNLEMMEETSAITSWKRFSVFLGIPMNRNLMVNYCEVTCSIILRPHSETRPFRKILWVRVRLCDFHQDQDVGRVIKVNFPFSNMKFRGKCDSHSNQIWIAARQDWVHPKDL